MTQFPKLYIVRFFQLLLQAKSSEASRILERIKEKLPKTEWNKGYFTALNGLASTKKSTLLNASDSPSQIHPVFPQDQDENQIRLLLKECEAHTQNKTHSNYDRGFFSAWVHFLRVLLDVKKRASDNLTPPLKHGA